MKPASDTSSKAISAAELIAARISDIESQLREIEQLTIEHPLEPINPERVEAARAFCAEAHALKDSMALDNSDNRQAIYRAVLNAQVEIDYALFPNIDPLQGWVRTRESDLIENSLCVDTQLMRLYFSSVHQGALVEFDYKPRKANLSNSAYRQSSQKNLLGNISVLPSLKEHLLTISEADIVSADLAKIVKNQCKAISPATNKILRHTPDTVGLRFNVALNSAGTDYTLFRDLFFRSGIGAHEQYYTTGFSSEYWLEGAETPSADSYLLIDWNFSLPTASAETSFARALASFGGESEAVLHFTSSQLLDHSYAPGGLYGLRLIDGTDNFVFDVRFSKPLFRILLSPIYIDNNANREGAAQEERLFQGVNVQFLLRAKDIFQDNHANTMFLSIR